jgi:hypothetical protein
MLMFFVGFATGISLTAWLLLGDDLYARYPSSDAAGEHADKWKHQRPLPPI